MGFRTRIYTLNAPKQLVLTMAVPRPTMAAGKGIYGGGGKEVGDEKSWPCERQEMGAKEFWSDERAERINEEGREDGCGGLNEELGEI